MWQIPCKMTNSSSKPLQTLGKWYQPRNPKKNPKPALKKDPKTISHPFEFFKVKLGMPPFFNNQRLERITYIEICYLKQDVGSAMLASTNLAPLISKRLHPQSLGHDMGEKIDAKKKKMMWRSVWGFQGSPQKDVFNMRGEHVNIEVANLMSGPSSYFHVRVFSLSFHTSMMNMLLTYLMSYFYVRDSRSVFLHLLARQPSFTFSPGIGRKRLPCKPTGFSILTSTVKGPGVEETMQKTVQHGGHA